MIIDRIDNDDKEIILHMVLSFISLFIYMYLGALGKAIVFPYVSYLVLKNEINYYPAILLQLMIETSVLYVILISAFLLMLFYYPELKRQGLRIIVNTLILLFLILAAHFTFKMVFMNIPFLDAIYQYQTCLGLFPFFIGVLYGGRYTQRINKYLVTVFILYLVAAFLRYNFRTIAFVVPFFFCFSFVFLLFTKSRMPINKLLRIVVSLLLLMLCLRSFTTYTVIITSVIPLLLVMSYLYESHKIVRLFRPLALSLCVFSFMTYVLINYKGDTGGYDFETGISISNFFERAQAKAFEDRAPFWDSVLKGVAEKKSISIPFEMATYDSDVNGKEVNAHFGAHNLYLDILNTYGVLVGGVIIAVFLYMARLCYNLLRIRKIPIFLLILGSISIVILIIGGMDGAYPLMIAFNLVLTSSMGLCYGVFIKQKSVSHEK